MKKIRLLCALIFSLIFYAKPMDESNELLFICTNAFVEECHDEKHAENFLLTIQCLFAVRNGISFPIESEETSSSNKQNFAILFAEKCCEFKSRLESSDKEAIINLHKEFLARAATDENCKSALSWINQDEHLSDYEKIFLSKFAIECACVHVIEISDDRMIKQTIFQTIAFITAVITQSIFREYKFLPQPLQQENRELAQSILERKHKIELQGNIPTFFELLGDNGIRYFIHEIEKFYPRKYELPMPTTWQPENFYLRIYQLIKDCDIKCDFDLDRALDSSSFLTPAGRRIHLNVSTTFAIRVLLKELKSIIMLFVHSDLMSRTSSKYVMEIIEQAIIVGYQEEGMIFIIDTQTSWINAKRFKNRVKPYEKV